MNALKKDIFNEIESKMKINFQLYDAGKINSSPDLQSMPTPERLINSGIKIK